MTQTTTKRWVHTLAQLLSMIPADYPEIQRIGRELLRKSLHEELAIAFTGHFSAGKSSLMNHIFEIDLLPTSPIPTSANVVTVRHGDDRIELHYDNSSRIVTGSYSEAALQALLKDGQRATAVSITRSDIPLPDGIAIVDTPGVDSTDEAHRLATEAQLHLADIIFYMMDYNHVQAEGNLQFVKDLTTRGKQVYLLINQIDKHRDDELSFPAFQQGVQAAFAAWQIQVAGVYFTSLKQLDHPYNQLNEVKALIQYFYQNKTERIEQNIHRETNYFIQQYITKKLAHLPTEEQLKQQQTALMDEINQLQQAQEHYEQEKRQIERKLLQDTDQLLQNAYLMPASLRDRAAAYLEAMQPNFKVGLLFTKQKTAQAKQEREQLFFQGLQETIATQLATHIEALVQQHAQTHGILSPVLTEQLQQQLPDLTISMLRETIKTGAGLNGNYVLTYTNDLSTLIKSLYRNYVRRYLSEHLPLLTKPMEEKRQMVTVELQTAKQRLKTIEQQLAERYSIAQEKTALLQVLQSEPTLVSEEQLTALLQQKTEAKTTTLTEEPLMATNDYEQPITNNINGNSNKRNILQQAETLLSQVPALEPFYTAIRTKRQQLEHQQYTVALFGAFSAGKSSFANALLGESVLPVSPNPTTATVCRICPPTNTHPHGTATITFKTVETLTEEVQALFQLFAYPTKENLTELVETISQVLQQPLETTRQKLSIPFLKAIQHGYKQLVSQLGQTVQLPQQEAISYMADEGKSAFVEEVSLYYDSPLSNLGITLVDTPGADSVHARHTAVAFRYMKQADALLFVTYYNHAFARADRELLIQLGRVQDTFALDKMYFLVNAADLAADQAELDAVVSYVAEQLQQVGIRHPRMYPVSSLQALNDKQKNHALDKNFQRFEQAFFRFIEQDTQETLLARMSDDVVQAQRWLTEMLTARQANEADRAAQQARWQKAEAELLQHWKQLTTPIEERNLTQEIQTLLYYVGERLRLRYYDEFAAFINPTTVREAGKRGRKQLMVAAKELLAFIGNDFIQECRATSLRIETWIQKSLTAFTQQQNDQHQSQLAGFLLATTDQIDLPEIEWQTPNWEENHPAFQRAVSNYKHAQSFFEGKGRDQMREQLQQYMDEVITAAITKATEQLNDTYMTTWQQSTQQLTTQWSTQLQQHFARLQDSLQSSNDEQLFIELKEKLEKIVDLLQTPSKG
jgi:predicted GTPase